jgi:glycosyltransferase involved in cell wall biosynthesis
MIKLSVVIPAYNEEKRILPTLKDVVSYLAKQDYNYEILVVNDGSTDKTAQTVKAFIAHYPKVRLIDNSKNQGKGAVVKQGMLEAKGQWRLFMDADNSTKISDIGNLWFFIDDAEVIIGSRYIAGSHITEKQSFLRRLISRAGNILSQIILLWGIKDTQCGFKLFSARAAERIFPKQTLARWSFDLEILAIAKKLGYKIKEVPVVWENAEGSKLKGGFKIAWRTFRDLIKIKCNLITHKY